jgi:nucleoid DNA-binding protein
LVGTEFKFIFTKMDILSYLTDLLNTQNEVGIEGLGTFFKQKLPGRYDTENHQFIPPTYILNFKREINEEASFSSFLSSSRNISNESAQYHIGLFVEDINRQLAVSNEADLDSIGKLSYVNDVLTLKEQGGIDLGSAFYGLPRISTKDLEKPIISADVTKVPETGDQSNFNDEQEVFEEITETQKVDIPRPILVIETAETYTKDENDQSTISENIVEQPIIEVEQPKEEEKTASPAPTQIQDLTPNAPTADAQAANIWHFDKEKFNAQDNNVNEPLEDKKSGNSGWTKALIVLILLALIAAGVYILKPTWFGQNPSSVVKAELKDTAAAVVQPVTVDTLQNPDSTSLSNPIDTVSKTLPVADLKKDSTTWEIIGASLTKREVNQYIRDMKARGYTAKPVPAMPGKKRIKMSIATFNSEESAIEGRKLLVQKLKNKDLYIFQNKNTQKPL